MPPLMQLPGAQYPTNALLNFAPISDALDANRLNALRQQQMAMQQQTADNQNALFQQQQREHAAQVQGANALTGSMPQGMQPYLNAMTPEQVGSFGQNALTNSISQSSPAYQADINLKNAEAYGKTKSADAAMLTASNGRNISVAPGNSLYAGGQFVGTAPNPEGQMDIIRQKSAATEAGKIDAGTWDKQRAGTEVERNLLHLTNLADKADPKVFAEATGPIMSNEDVSKGAYASGVISPAAKDLNNRMGHQIEGLTTAFMTAASSRGMTMSDARMQKFEDTMGAMRKATSKEEFMNIAGDARGIIRSIFALPPLPDAPDSGVKTPNATPYPPQDGSRGKVSPVPSVQQPQGRVLGTKTMPIQGQQVPNSITPQQAAPAALPKLTNDAAGHATYASLAPGSQFIDDKGQLRTKGGQ